MKTFPMLLVLLPLAACGGQSAPVSAGEAACRREARSAPGVGEALSRLNPTNAMQADAMRAEAAAAERRAFTACMRGRGQSIPSIGVEPQGVVR